MNVIQLMERLGSNADFDGEGNLNLGMADLDPELRAALENRDTQALERLIGTRSNLMMALFPAEDDEPAEQDDGDDDEVPEQESRRIAI